MDKEAKAIIQSIRDLAKAKGLTLAQLPEGKAFINLGHRLDLEPELGYLMISEGA